MGMSALLKPQGFSSARLPDLVAVVHVQHEHILSFIAMFYAMVIHFKDSVKVHCHFQVVIGPFLTC